MISSGATTASTFNLIDAQWISGGPRTFSPHPTGTGTGPPLLELTAVWPGQWGGALSFTRPEGQKGGSTMLDIIIDIIIAWGADWGDTSD